MFFFSRKFNFVTSIVFSLFVVFVAVAQSQTRCATAHQAIQSAAFETSSNSSHIYFQFSEDHLTDDLTAWRPLFKQAFDEFLRSANEANFDFRYQLGIQSLIARISKEGGVDDADVQQLVSQLWHLLISLQQLEIRSDGAGSESVRERNLVLQEQARILDEFNAIPERARLLKNSAAVTEVLMRKSKSEQALNIAALEHLADTLTKDEFSSFFSQHLFSNFRALQQTPGSDISDGFETHPFNVEGTWRTLIRLAIEKGNEHAWYTLSTFTFYNTLTNSLNDLLLKFIKKNNQDVLGNLAQTVFSQPHKGDLSSLIREAIRRGNEDVLATLAKATFSRPHTKSLGDLIELLIDRSEQISQSAHQPIYTGLARDVFSQEFHWDKKKSIQRLIGLMTGDTLSDLVEGVFVHLDNSSVIRSLLPILIQRLESKQDKDRLLDTLIRYGYTSQGMKDAFAEVRLLLESPHLTSFHLETLRHHGSFMEGKKVAHRILQKARLIADHQERVDFLNREFAKPKRAKK